MSTRPERGNELDVDEAVRALLLLMPQLVGRAKRTPPPAELAGLALGPRHLSLLSYLLFDGPMTVNALAARLEVAPTTVSLMVADLSRGGVVERREDPDDRRRRIVSITDAGRPAIEGWLGPGAAAWRAALGPLTPAERSLVVDTLRAYERAANERAANERAAPVS
ncbi:winged helix-turn-helix transcriptional regulator [Frankia sp. CNm7]|uniref:Winged helix-turn-helix transcriptional regulator n=1 Tax=Frankia nepalensis TaxID=1836974 RepID=A0A937RKE0_9ACTN|nr:MarR family winged helix-turn-helix transcriptional regulator [Frankia nepalensis]MBL7496563.1 winged helix-turn-helix transcriptional regulator [Frankia nepalensis]MBL7508782.1 winged helix-turn-helix transcriptional regulator [Frankia nepalensis]MBL7520591.1 winged helix-turn-helix transcriptional regulator [Frankia nepalensis]MBL7627536.1 winged helix-turn-helix transcriptional regulator [Frankia nepalensis]